MTTVPMIPPHDERAEIAVLGSVLLEGELKTFAADLAPEAFYCERHRVIWNAMQTLSAESLPIDLVLLTAELERTGKLEEAGGMNTLIGLGEMVPTSAHAEHYVQILSEHHFLRKLLAHAQEVQRRIYTRDTPLEDIAHLATQPPIFEHGQMTLVSMADVIAQVVAEAQAGTGPRGVGTGLGDLDRAINGLEPGRLYVLAARPAAGKSVMAFQFGTHVAKTFGRVLGFSLEMPATEVIARVLASESRVGLERLNKSRQRNDEKLKERDFERLERTSVRLQSAPFDLLIRPGLTLSQLLEQVRRAHQQAPLKLFVLDYLQLVQIGDGRRSENATQRVAEVTTALKSLALELNIPVLALSQMSRAVENRPGRMPQLSDLRDSGNIEQDADVVMFIHREHQPAPGHENLADLIVAKNRNGPLCTVKMVFQSQFVRFCGHTDEEQTQDSLITAPGR